MWPLCRVRALPPGGVQHASFCQCVRAFREKNDLVSDNRLAFWASGIGFFDKDEGRSCFVLQAVALHVPNVSESIIVFNSFLLVWKKRISVESLFLQCSSSHESNYFLIT